MGWIWRIRICSACPSIPLLSVPALLLPFPFREREIERDRERGTERQTQRETERQRGRRMNRKEKKIIPGSFLAQTYYENLSKNITQRLKELTYHRRGLN